MCPVGVFVVVCNSTGFRYQLFSIFLLACLMPITIAAATAIVVKIFHLIYAIFFAVFVTHFFMSVAVTSTKISLTISRKTVKIGPVAIAAKKIQRFIAAHVKNLSINQTLLFNVPPANIFFIQNALIFLLMNTSARILGHALHVLLKISLLALWITRTLVLLCKLKNSLLGNIFH